MSTDFFSSELATDSAEPDYVDNLEQTNTTQFGEDYSWWMTLVPVSIV